MKTLWGRLGVAALLAGGTGTAIACAMPDYQEGEVVSIFGEALLANGTQLAFVSQAVATVTAGDRNAGGSCTPADSGTAVCVNQLILQADGGLLINDAGASDASVVCTTIPVTDDAGNIVMECENGDHNDDRVTGRGGADAGPGFDLAMYSIGDINAAAAVSGTTAQGSGASVASTATFVGGKTFHGIAPITTTPLATVAGVGAGGTGVTGGQGTFAGDSEGSSTSLKLTYPDGGTGADRALVTAHLAAVAVLGAGNYSYSGTISAVAGKSWLTITCTNGACIWTGKVYKISHLTSECGGDGGTAECEYAFVNNTGGQAYSGGLSYTAQQIGTVGTVYSLSAKESVNGTGTQGQSASMNGNATATISAKVCPSTGNCAP